MVNASIIVLILVAVYTGWRVFQADSMVRATFALLVSFIAEHCDVKTTHSLLAESVYMLLQQKTKPKVIQSFFSSVGSKDLDDISFSLEQPLADDELPILATRTDFCVPITNAHCKGKSLKQAI